MPWKLTDDANGDDLMLIRHGTPMTAPIVNVLNDFLERQLLTRKLRLGLALWNIDTQPAVPEARSNDTLPAEIIHLAQQFQSCDEHRDHCDQVAKD